MYERAIFLDIDGVLNTKESWKTPFSLNDECVKNFCAFANRDGEGTKIILVSSWKTGWSPLAENQTQQIVDLNKKLSIHGCSIFGRTRDLGNRQKEIIDYLQNHSVDYFAIVDDDESEYKDFVLGGVYLVNAESGFAASDIMRVKWKKANAHIKARL